MHPVPPHPPVRTWLQAISDLENLALSTTTTTPNGPDSEPRQTRSRSESGSDASHSSRRSSATTTMVVRDQDHIMTPPNDDGGYFDLIRTRQVGVVGHPGSMIGEDEVRSRDQDGWVAGSGMRSDGLGVKGKEREICPSDEPELEPEPELASTSWGRIILDDVHPSPSIRAPSPLIYPSNPENPGPIDSHPLTSSALTDRVQTPRPRTPSILFGPRGAGVEIGAWSRPGTPLGAKSGRTTPMRGSTASPRPRPSLGPPENDRSGLFGRTSTTTTTTTTSFPEWLRSRPRSSSSASILSNKTSQSTGSGSITSLSSRIKVGMKSRLSFKDKHQSGSASRSGSASPSRSWASGSASVPVSNGLVQDQSKTSAKRFEGKEKKDGPRGFMRRLMVRSKTSPLVVTTIHHHPVEHRIVGNVPSARESRAEASTMGIVPGRSGSEDMNMVWTRRAGETEKTDRADTPVVRTMTHDEVLDQTLPSSFETILPREIRLLVFRALVDLHVAEHETLVKRGKWKGVVAQTRWYGETAGRRELLRLRSVSTSWNDLAMDGQLWQDCDMHAYLDHIPPSALIKLLWSSSSCVRNLDAYGWHGLPGGSLVSALNGSGRFETSLRKLDLQGCRDLGEGDITWLLDHSPHLKWLSLKGLKAVNDSHWNTMMASTSLEYLDISYCKMIRLSNVPHAGPTSKITHLLAAGLMSKITMGLLAHHIPNLQVLDLSHSPSLKDWDIQSFVTPPIAEWKPVWERLPADGRRGRRSDKVFAFLTEDEAGQAGPVAWMEFVPRRVIRLKKLVLSECPSLTDQTCRYLAHAVPQLEVFEMAHADGNPGIRSAGLVAMLSNSPKIKRIDLEGAVEIDDEVLSALTPQGPNTKNSVGSCLEVLSIGFADDVSTEAMLQLVRRCPRLRQLDVDNTNATDLVVKEFVRKRGQGTSLSVVDCRGVSRNVVEALENRTRPRDGWRGWQAAPLRYNDGLKSGKTRDECTLAPVVQSFWTWNSVPRADRPGFTPHARHNGGTLSSIEMDALDGHYDRSCVIM